MIRIMVCLLIPIALIAEDHETKFTVEKIEQPKVQQFAKADDAVIAATKQLEQAQEVLAKAKQAREKILKEIKVSVQEFEDTCGLPPAQEPGSAVYVAPPPRKWRRAEIHGDWLLVSDGISDCAPGWITTLTGNATIENTSIKPARH